MTIRDEDEILFLIGKLYANLQSLEFVLRGALYEKGSQPHNPIGLGVSINSFAVGDNIPENAMTDYSSLGQLIDRYNSEIANGELEKKVNRDIVSVRDALAHGRASANKMDEDTTLIKFTKPKNSSVTVSFSQRLTKTWLKEKIGLVYSEVIKVVKANGLDEAPQ